jgi:hypothetical protein
MLAITGRLFLFFKVQHQFFPLPLPLPTSTSALFPSHTTSLPHYDKMKLFFFLSTSATLLLSTQSLAKPINEDHIFKRGTSSITTDGASLNGMEFNCVIVGGGTAGLAAAYQLAKDPNRKVLVIEAGGDTRNNDKVSKQSAYTQAFGDKQLDWNSATVPQQTTGGAVRRLHAGKGLGGTSTINGGAFSVPPSTQSESVPIFSFGDTPADRALPQSMHSRSLETMGGAGRPLRNS